MYKNYEILLDTFKYLEQNELEKSLLVSRAWKGTISSSSKLNHRRRIYKLTITKQTNSFECPVSNN